MMSMESLDLRYRAIERNGRRLGQPCHGHPATAEDDALGHAARATDARRVVSPYEMKGTEFGNSPLSRSHRAAAVKPRKTARSR